MFFTMTVKGDETPRYVYKGNSYKDAIDWAIKAWNSDNYAHVWVVEEVMGSTLWRNGFTLDEYGEPVTPDTEEEEEEEEDTSCQICGKGPVTNSDYLDGKIECTSCGATYDPGNGEEVQEWTVDLYCNLSDMTETEATDHIYNLLANIEKTYGVIIVLDKLS